MSAPGAAVAPPDCAGALSGCLDAPEARSGAPPREMLRFDVEALKRRWPLAQLLSQRYGIELRPEGGGYMALCPFHDDHEPSLFVDPRDDHFHCFSGRCAGPDGRPTHGDVLAFVMRAERCSFVEACRRLGAEPLATAAPAMPAAPSTPPSTVNTGAPPCAPAAEPAVDLAPADGISRRRAAAGALAPERPYDRLTLEEQVVMNTALAVYRHCLWRDARVLHYLRVERGLPDWVILECGLGYADGQTLEAYLRRRGGLRVAQTLGLLRRAAGGDLLDGCVVVPELRGGNAVWLIGRRLPWLEASSDPVGGQRTRPRYVALPGERPVLGYERAAGRREAFVCEGVFDYLTAVAWRLPACSPCGTHLPADRLGFLARARTVFGVFDGDEAGREADTRFAAVLGDRWRSLRLPDGADLNDLGRRRDGAARFFALLAAAREPAGHEAASSEPDAGVAEPP